MKPFLLMTVMAGCILLGRGKASRCTERVRRLSTLCSFLRTAREGICYRSLPPDELIGLFRQRCRRDIPPFLNVLEEERQRGADFAVAFRHSLENLSLGEKERDTLLAWGEAFGKSDRESQLFACDEALCRLNELCGAAAEEAEKQSRMWMKLGALGGLFAVIMLV